MDTKYKNEQPTITIYGASASGLEPVFLDAAAVLGRYAAENGIAVVNGGGTEGIMGAVNDAVIDAGGIAIGIIPKFMADRGWGHKNLTRMEVTADMHDRKLRMAHLADGVVALPGGVGTMDELMEIITWRQLRLFTGPVVILNTDGYWDGLLGMINTARTRGFMRKGISDDLWVVTDSPEEAVRLALDPALRLS